MDIYYLGHSSFRLRGREATVITDPFPKGLGYNLGRIAAQIVTVSHHHPNHDAVSSVVGTPTVVEGPGEYEISSVFITGVGTYHDREKGARRGKNTVYVVEMDDLTVCHLGDLGHVLTTDETELMSQVDVLLVPVGGVTSLDAASAAEVVTLLDPRIVIPMHYRTPVADTALEGPEGFFRQMGLKEPQAESKLSIAHSSLPSETQVVLLDYR